MKNTFFVAEICTGATSAMEMKTRFDLGNFKTEEAAREAARRDLESRCAADDMEPTDDPTEIAGHPRRLSENEAYRVTDYDRDIVYTVLSLPEESDMKFGIMEEHTTPYGDCEIRILRPIYTSRKEAEATIKFAEEHKFAPVDCFYGESEIILTKPLGNGRFKCGHRDEDESQWDDFFTYKVVTILS